MYKLLRIIFAVFFMMIALPQTSNAHLRAILQPAQFKEAFDKAVFVGKAEVVKIDPSPHLTQAQKDHFKKLGVGNLTAITFMPIQSYKTPLKSSQTDITANNMTLYIQQGSRPWRMPEKAGIVYEEMIWKQGDDYIFPPAVPDNAWALYRTHALQSGPNNDWLMAMHFSCGEDNGKWIVIKSGYGNTEFCRYPDKKQKTKH
jgi:hypothetical protein